MKRYYLSFIGCLFISFVYSQKYYSKAGSIHFLSEAPIETIQAINNNARAVLDFETGQMEWSVLMY